MDKNVVLEPTVLVLRQQVFDKPLESAGEGTQRVCTDGSNGILRMRSIVSSVSYDMFSYWTMVEIDYLESLNGLERPHRRLGRL